MAVQKEVVAIFKLAKSTKGILEQVQNLSKYAETLQKTYVLGCSLVKGASEAEYVLRELEVSYSRICEL